MGERPFILDSSSHSLGEQICRWNVAHKQELVQKMAIGVTLFTFRLDEETGRARINKKGSTLDKEQRLANEYFYIS